MVVLPADRAPWPLRPPFSGSAAAYCFLGALLSLAVACALFERLQPTTSTRKQVLSSDPQAVSVPGRNLASVPARVLRSPAVRAAMPAATTLRPITKVVQGNKMMEGAGVRICRTVGTSQLRNLDPFLMLDEMKSPPNEAAAGFPDHPHRGFETCSIMLSGKMEHRDSFGNHGIIGPGGVQWMTAGRGIVHSEMPAPTDDKMLHGFQLWINLPAKDKMVKPRYQDYQADDIPTVDEGGVKVRVMAGESYGATGPITLRNPGMLLDVILSPGATFTQQVPEEFNGFCYVYEGSGKIGGSKASVQQALVMGKGSIMEASADASTPLKFLLIAGKPIGEPIVQHGPFVMNTQAEIMQAFNDYASGRLQNPNDDVWAAA